MVVMALDNCRNYDLRLHRPANLSDNMSILKTYVFIVIGMPVQRECRKQGLIYIEDSNTPQLRADIPVQHYPRYIVVYIMVTCWLPSTSNHLDSSDSDQSLAL